MEKKYLYVLVAVILILIVVALIVYTNTAAPGPSSIASYDNQLVPQSLISQLQIPNNISNAVNATLSVKEGLVAAPKSVNSSPLTINGKPEILYIGAEYCPYCAAERWAMVVALLRFGTFTGLKYMTSSATDAYPNTPTFTFYNSTYTSQYIVFVPVETTTNKPANSSYTGKTILGYPVLQTPNSSEDNLLGTFDTAGSIPFIDFGNKSVQTGSSYNPPLVLSGLNWTQAAGYLQNPSTTQAKTIIATANLFTAQICEQDGNMPASVCTQPYVTELEGS
jgi:thiol-disulfide isomerase/thioredoxin